MENYQQKLNLLYEVGKKVGSVSEISQLLDQVLDMTQRTLRASASSVLLIDPARQELHFRVAGGRAASTLQQMKLSLDSGIAGWVARHARPLVVNDVTKDRRFNPEIDKMTGFVTRSMLAVPMIAGRETVGVLEVLNKIDGSGFDEQDLEVMVALASTAAVAISNARLHQAMLEGYRSTVKALTAAIDAKDPYTCGHSQRVTEYTLLGAGILSLDPGEMQALEYGGLLHDIGKIGINDSILRKPGGLTPEEWSLMRQHSLIGANIIAEIPFLETVRNLILHHHERYDGTGYPEGLSRQDIPIGARLLAVADAFDTMTTDRSYRRAVDFDHAISELHRCTGTQFCPVAVQAFLRGIKQHRVPAN